jgi:hypothetical protein
MTDTNATAQAPDDGVMGMSDAPERIWTASTEGKCHVGFDTPSMNCTNEYIRADILAQTLAANAALVKRLEEARGVIEFYADAAGWNHPPVRTIDGLVSVEYENQASKIQRDRGKSARAFLAGGE